MGGKAKAPPPPDYTPIANASAASASLAYKQSKEQLRWAKIQYSRDSKITNKVVNAFMKRQNQLDRNAIVDRRRWERVFKPVEDQLVRDAKSYNTAARREAEAGRAAGAVSNEFANARAAAQDRLESFGIDPSQTRAGALDISMRTQEAAARAGAADTARRAVEDRGMALRTEAINLGRGYPGVINQSYGLAGNQGSGAVGSRAQTTQVGAGTMGTGTQWSGVGNQALGTWGNALTAGYNAQMQQYNANQQASSGWGSALGLVGGIGMKLLTGGLMAEGGKVVDPDAPPEAAVPTAEMPHDGWRVTSDMSPSRGAVEDDVPATVEGVAPARLNADEFVIPKDQLMWHGEKFFQKLIQKGREEQAEATAKPRIAAIPGAPTGNPAREAAIPLR
jgi:hypothetical protein